MHYSFLKPRSLRGSCLAGEDCLFFIEIIPQQEKSCPCEKSDFLAMHQSAEEERRGIEVESGNCTSKSFFCYRLSDKTNSPHCEDWQIIATSKALYNHYPDYLIFCWHLSCVWSLTWRLQPALSVLLNKLILLASVHTPSLFPSCACVCPWACVPWVWV